MKITIGCDHGSRNITKIVEFLEKEGHQVLDVKIWKRKVDYPDYAHIVAEEVLAGADLGS